MSLVLSSREIRRVRLIDDDPHVRSGYKYHIEDLHLEPDEVQGPIRDLPQLIESFDKQREAAICDLNLTTKNYSSANGDEVVSNLYSLQIPAVLCTRWAGHLPEEVRFRRRHIPIVLAPSEVTPDSLRLAFEFCIREFRGEFSNGRRPWRTVVRVESGEDAGGGKYRLNLIIPSWDPSTGLTCLVPGNASLALKTICEKVVRGEIVRAFAQVNLGVESEQDVYIHDWALS